MAPPGTDAFISGIEEPTIEKIKRDEHPLVACAGRNRRERRAMADGGISAAS